MKKKRKFRNKIRVHFPFFTYLQLSTLCTRVLLALSIVRLRGDLFIWKQEEKQWKKVYFHAILWEVKSYSVLFTRFYSLRHKSWHTLFPFFAFALSTCIFHENIIQAHLSQIQITSFLFSPIKRIVLSVYNTETTSTIQRPLAWLNTSLFFTMNK